MGTYISLSSEISGRALIGAWVLKGVICLQLTTNVPLNRVVKFRHFKVFVHIFYNCLPFKKKSKVVYLMKF